MKKCVLWLLCCLLCLSPAASLADGINGQGELPEAILRSLSENTAFRDFSIVSWTSIAFTGNIFVSLHKDTTNRLVMYTLQEQDNGWVHSWYSDTVLARGRQSYLHDASNSVLIDDTVLGTAVGWRQAVDEGMPYNHMGCAKLWNGRWYVTNCSTNEPSPFYVLVSANRLTYYNQYNGEREGRVYGVVQDELRYFDVNALPKTIKEARQKLSVAPELPRGDLTAVEVNFTGKQKYDVYMGPDSRYDRAANGKAAVSTNDWIQVFGSEDGYLLIQYAISGGQMRFGYISASAAPKNADIPSLSLAYTTGATARAAAMTDDPLGKHGTVLNLAAGQVVTYLAAMGDWAYVEVETGGKAMRGFLPMDAIEACGYASYHTRTMHTRSGDVTVTVQLGYDHVVADTSLQAAGLTDVMYTVSATNSDGGLAGFQLYCNNTLLQTQEGNSVQGRKAFTVYLTANVPAVMGGSLLGLCPVYQDGTVGTSEMITLVLE